MPTAVIDENHPEPDEDGWEWRLVDVTCGHCGAVNQIHEQKGAWLKAPEPAWPGAPKPPAGIAWECNVCHGKNVLGYVAPAPPDEYVLECGSCHSTFAPSAVAKDKDGTWKCEVCDTPNRDVHHTDQAESAEVSG